MATATFIVRIILGIILVVFPLNALFIKAFKPQIPAKGGALMDAFRETGYLLPFIQGTELILGIVLLTGYFTPLALLILAPISINILLFHIFLAPPVLGPGLLVFSMNVFLLYAYRAEFFRLLEAR